MRHEESSQRLTAVLWILFAFLVWILLFRGYLTSKFELISDALSYYDHTKFFIENLGRGVYPLWDPFWYNGAPNDFFLRRIGAFNPFYLIILVLKCLGVPYTLSYLWFLAGYYFSGMTAFYLLAMRMYQDRLMAYGGFLILLFSALGTRLFDSYMMLVTVPLIWFFYFLVAFSQTPRKHFFLGIALSFMVLAGTYIPFYFLIILGLFLFFFSLIYFNRLPEIIRRYADFFKQNRLLVFFTLMVLILSFVPIITFFHDSAHGQVVMPERHGSAGTGHTLVVPHQTLDWGAVEDFMYSVYFADLRLFKFAVVYVPFFSVIVLCLGLMGRINRRAALIFLLGLALLCCIVPHGLPLYDFFYRHVFFLKYFRNLHFFIWFFLIPLFVLLALEHWKMFTEIKIQDTRFQGLLLVYVLAVHLAVLVFIVWRNDAVLSTYLMVLLSLVFWSLMALKQVKANGWGFLLLTLTVLVQPLEAYHYFALKATAHVRPYDYDFSSASFRTANVSRIKPEDVPAGKDALYYVAGGYNFVYQNVSNYALAKYLQNNFILVDHLSVLGREDAGPVLERNFSTDTDEAVVFNDTPADLKLNGDDPGPPARAERLDNNSNGFKLLAFDANHLRLALDLPYEKFLVYNDSYDPYWRVSINHHPAVLYEANGAFKGVWVPAGQNVIEFSYGRWWQYALNILLSIFAIIFLIGTIYYARFA